MGERYRSEIRVPAVAVSTNETLEDYNYIWPVVVEPTGLFGLGRPIYRGNYDGVSEVEDGLKVIWFKRIKKKEKPTILWADAEHSYDKMVNGLLVEEVKIILEDPPIVEGFPLDLDS